MSFTSVAFLLFLPIVLALYWLLRRHLHWQNSLIVVASYVFYGWWDWRFLGLIALTSLCSYASGLAIEQSSGRRRRLWATANIVLNLGILGVFKYFNFFAENFRQLLAWLGMNADMPTLRLVLPVGISFYTFQALSYTIDVYRRRLPATRNIIAFFAYISFFPQLVAGPIERATHLLPQMLRARTLYYSEAVDGLRQMLWGFVKKVIVADTCALAVDMVWADPSAHNSLELVVGAVLFSIQIYGDFSGYSDIAVGCSRLFGIRLMQNFAYPYFARDMADFWRRWHISLMTWLRDYVYIPLGGNRCSASRAALNTLVVFLVSGLWHGAAWTFVLWGLYHALLLTALRKRRLTMFGTFALVTFGWVLFRAPGLSAFMQYLQCLIPHPSTLTFQLSTSLSLGKTALLWSAILLAVEWLQRHRAHGLDLPACGVLRYRAVRWTIYYALIALLLWLPHEQHQFIYFQF